MRKVIRQIWRGCGELPYVGAHPGTIWVGACPFIGALVDGGIGFLLMAAWVWPLYCYGAYERAELSDKLEAQR